MAAVRYGHHSGKSGGLARIRATGNREVGRPSAILSLSVEARGSSVAAAQWGVGSKTAAKGAHTGSDAGFAEIAASDLPVR